MSAETKEPIVFVVDDDPAVCDSMRFLLRAVGLNSKTFADPREFLDQFSTDQPGCLVLDIRMPGMTGLEVQEELVRRKALLPIVMITGHATVDSAVHALRAGAVHFLQKPVRENELLECVRAAIQQDLDSRASLAEEQEIRSRIAKLTPRETEVMEKVVEGNANKVIAIDFGLSERTVEIHRSRVMKKMKANSLPHLVRMVLAVRDSTESEGGAP